MFEVYFATIRRSVMPALLVTTVVAFIGCGKSSEYTEQAPLSAVQSASAAVSADTPTVQPQRNLIAVKLNGRYGYINQRGDMVIQPQFDFAEPFYEDLAAVRLSDGQWEFIDPTGEYAIEPRYEFASHFGNGLGFVGQGGKFGYIDRTGEFAIEPKFDGGGSFTGELAPVSLNDKWGFIDQSGKWVIEPKYDGAEDFHEGLARVNIGGYRDGMFGYIDRKGDLIIPAKFNYCEHFSEGLAIARIRERSGVIDKTGQWIVEPQYLDADIAFSDGLVCVTTSSGKQVYINTTGDAVLILSFDAGQLFSSGLAAVRTSGLFGKWGFMNKNGTLAIEPRFDRALPFVGEIAPVMMYDRWGLINREGEFVVQPQFDAMSLR